MVQEVQGLPLHFGIAHDQAVAGGDDEVIGHAGVPGARDSDAAIVCARDEGATERIEAAAGARDDAELVIWRHSIAAGAGGQLLSGGTKQPAIGRQAVEGVGDLAAHEGWSKHHHAAGPLAIAMHIEVARGDKTAHRMGDHMDAGAIAP
jgi:hypothetical protein